ncbi:MAG: cytochrome B [Deltaproteobacteria bacterium]|nr:MAG: cytochrome B [Deltaproteobacteria bacterium]
MIRSLYDWILKWAETPYGAWALFILALCEASFFPIPPDLLLIALAIAVPARAFHYAAICTAGSVIGGCIGYLIGWQFMALIGTRIVAFYGFEARLDYVRDLYAAYDAWVVFVAGFTPIPYKVVTVASGLFSIHFGVFVAASFVSRAARFFLVGGLIYLCGSRIHVFIDRYFNSLVTAFTVLLIAGFAAVKLLF